MSTLGILAGVGVTLSAGTVGCYALWHNGYDTWLLSDLGRLASYILFPGESDLYDVAAAHRLGNANDITNHAPCILCTKNQTVSVDALPEDTVWDGTSHWYYWWKTDAKGACKESARKDALNRNYRTGGKTQHDKDVYNYRMYDCEKTRPGGEPGKISYNLALTKDCISVKGVGAMPIGTTPMNYLKARLFPTASSLVTVKDTDINARLFPEHSPYTRYSTFVRTGQLKGTVSPNFVGFFVPVKDIVSTTQVRPFMPPMLNKAHWKLWNDHSPVKEYLCIEQLDNNPSFINTTITATINVSQLVRPEPVKFTSDYTFDKYLQQIKFYAVQIIRYNGKKYYTFEYTPDYQEGVEYSGKSEHPTFTTVNQWQDEQCASYIQKFLTTNSFKYVPLSTPVTMKRLVGKDGFWNV